MATIDRASQVGSLVGLVLILGCARASFAANTVNPAAAPPGRLKVAGCLACSSLVRCKQPTDEVFSAISAIGFKWVDLACLNWAPQVAVPKLLEYIEGFNQVEPMRECGRFLDWAKPL